MRHERAREEGIVRTGFQNYEALCTTTPWATLFSVLFVNNPLTTSWTDSRAVKTLRLLPPDFPLQRREDSNIVPQRRGRNSINNVEYNLHSTCPFQTHLRIFTRPLNEKIRRSRREEKTRTRLSERLIDA